MDLDAIRFSQEDYNRLAREGGTFGPLDAIKLVNKSPDFAEALARRFKERLADAQPIIPPGHPEQSYY
eukprot:16437703-Heterocapsa_arctica.AAC.1